MATVMATFSLLAFMAYLLLARPAERCITFAGGIGTHFDR
jgi:hypothetical protein